MELVQLRVRSRTSAAAAKLSALEVWSLSVPKAVGSISRAGGTAALETIGAAEIRLPSDMPRLVNAATLKRLLKASQARVRAAQAPGDRREVGEDSPAVDLLDDSVEFRPGAVQIFS